jgi:DNA polymerase elongation subunit (family B)
MTPNKPLIKRLYFDIETSPCVVYTWGAGFKLNISHENIIKERKVICIAWKWEHEKDAHVMHWDSKQNDKTMLGRFLEIANEADECVGHYIDHFDAPWFRTRCLIHGFDPIPIYKTIDTKAWASKYFYFNSNKLDYISKVLGFEGKIRTEFDLWKRVMDGDEKALAYMCEYCMVDVIRLEQVFHKLEGYMKPKSHAGVMGGEDNWSCPHCGSRHVGHEKIRTTGAGTIQHQMRCRKCKSYFQVNDSTYKRFTQR